MGITISISNCKVVGLEQIERSITIMEHVKNYQNSSFTVPYVLEHFNSNREKITDIPDRYYTLVASADKKIWVGPGGATSRTYVAGWQEFDMFTFFQILQKSLTDEQILNAQIADLDSNGFFD